MNNTILKMLIPSNSKQEKIYCKKYGIELQRLSNGARIVGISCKKDSTNWAEINWIFSSGAYGNYPGSVHFLEHLFNKTINTQAKRNSLYTNARTNHLEVRTVVSGVANPKVINYGIWTILEGVRKSLESPTSHNQNIEKIIETERQVIKTEIQTRATNHNYHVTTNFLKSIYHHKNPFNDATIVSGTESDIDKINIDVLKKVEEKVLISKNLLISVFSEGDSKIINKLVGILKRQFLKFPKKINHKDDTVLNLRSKINEKLKEKKYFEYDTKIKNGLITNQFNWIFKYKFGSKEYFALRILKNILSGELHQYSREKGWGYFTEVGVVRPIYDMGILNTRIDIKKNNKIDVKEGVIEVFKNIKKISKDLINLEKKRQVATPISVSDRFSWVVNGLSEFNQIINADKIREGMLSVTSRDLDNLLDEIITTSPITIITGDLN